MKDCALSAGPCRVRHLGVTSCRLAFSWLALNRTGLAACAFAPSRVSVYRTCHRLPPRWDRFWPGLTDRPAGSAWLTCDRDNLARSRSWSVLAPFSRRDSVIEGWNRNSVLYKIRNSMDRSLEHCLNSSYPIWTKIWWNRRCSEMWWWTMFYMDRNIQWCRLLQQSTCKWSLENWQCFVWIDCKKLKKVRSLERLIMELWYTK